MATIKTNENVRAGAEIVYGGEECYRHSIELLEELGFPKGVLPLKDLVECGRVKETGFVWMKQAAPYNHVFKEINTCVNYGVEVTAYVEKGKMKKMTGVKSKQLLMWVPVVEMSVVNEAEKIYFKTPMGIGKSFPITVYMTGLLSTAMRRTSEWILSQEIPSDVTVHVGGTSFSLHKFPLVSKSGYIRKLVSESVDPDHSIIELPDIPGGAEAFELAAKFCYGINFDISTENIAALRCASEFLEMTEDYANGNLVTRTEAFLTEVVLKTLAGTVSILHQTEHLPPTTETIKLVSRCIDTIAYIACKDSQFLASNTEGGLDGAVSFSGSNLKSSIVDWWAEDLTVLRIDVFQRVIIAMIARGFKNYALGPILMLYAQKSLRGLELFGKGRKKINLKEEHEKRVVLETIVSLLPREKNAMSVSFLSMLLRAAIYLEATVACRLDLEKRMGSQLGQAVLDDLLIPSFSFMGDTLFDVDSVQRILVNFLEHESEWKHLGYTQDNEFVTPPPSDMERVGKLMESYLSEIASDRYLSVSKFISLAERITEHSRATDDGMYRSIDIFLKAHPGLSDLERKKVCSVMDCQKLSREACAHAAQNDRLPVQTVVQVLYYEQQRLRDVMSTGGSTHSGSESPALTPKENLYTLASDEMSKLRRENQDLKFELLKMKMRLKEMEKHTDKLGTGSPMRGTVTYSADKPPLPKKSIISSVSKKLGKLMHNDLLATQKRKPKPAKDRRHSIS